MSAFSTSECEVCRGERVTRGHRSEAHGLTVVVSGLRSYLSRKTPNRKEAPMVPKDPVWGVAGTAGDSALRASDR